MLHLLSHIPGGRRLHSAQWMVQKRVCICHGGAWRSIPCRPAAAAPRCGRRPGRCLWPRPVGCCGRLAHAGPPPLPTRRSAVLPPRPDNGAGVGQLPDQWSCTNSGAWGTPAGGGYPASRPGGPPHARCGSCCAAIPRTTLDRRHFLACDWWKPSSLYCGGRRWATRANPRIGRRALGDAHRLRTGLSPVLHSGGRRGDRAAVWRRQRHPEQGHRTCQAVGRGEELDHGRGIHPLGRG